VAELIGYTNVLSAQPGERVTFYISAGAPSYQAHLLRMRHGHDDPLGPGIIEDELDSPVNGRYDGGLQLARAGSCVVVPPAAQIDQLGSLSVTAWVYPTLLGKGKTQAVVASTNPDRSAGFALELDPEGRPRLRLGLEGGPIELTSPEPVLEREWWFLGASYDAETGVVRLVQHCASPWVAAVEPVAARLGTGGIQPAHAPVVIAGSVVPGTSPIEAADDLFDGKIDRPRIYNVALSDSDLLESASILDVASLPDGLVAAWAFGADHGSDTIQDAGPHQLHGRAVNAPTRAVTGHNWTAGESHFKLAPEQWDAIHFHADNLDDAGWEPSLVWEVPEDLASGVYALRISDGEAEDRVPIIVRPKRGADADGAVLFVMPTMRLLAYANEEIYRGLPPADPLDVLRAEHPEWCLGMYSYHADGSGICHSSWLRPIPNMHPTWKSPFDDARNRYLGGNLTLLYWLEMNGYTAHVVTDGDVHDEGLDLLSSYRVVLTGGHPEYTTERMLDAYRDYIHSGGHFMYLGGNGFHWVVTVHPDHPHRLELRRGGQGLWRSAPGEHHHCTTGELGGMWLLRGRPEHSLVGVGITAEGHDAHSGYRLTPESADPRVQFITEGIGRDEIIGDFGFGMGGAAGDEIDRTVPQLGTPRQTITIATSQGFHSEVFEVDDRVWEGDPQSSDGVVDDSDDPRRRSDVVYIESPSGGAVFSTGSIAWVSSLLVNGGDNNASRMTGNVLRCFAEEPSPKERSA
jgi:N,N-dimethylformamidase